MEIQINKEAEADPLAKKLSYTVNYTFILQTLFVKWIKYKGTINIKDKRQALKMREKETISKYCKFKGSSDLGNEGL